MDETIKKEVEVKPNSSGTLTKKPTEKKVDLKKNHLLIEVDENGKAVIPDAFNDMQIRYETSKGYPLERMHKQVQGVIDGPPFDGEVLYKQACSNDDITIKSWRDQWIKQATENSKKYDFNLKSALNVFQKEKSMPIVVAGSGPSLKKNAVELKKKKDIKIVSCLHNFGYFEDLGVMTKDDYYINLDAGDITIPEVFELGKKKEAEYWKKSKDRTLITHVVGHPELLNKWQGEILFFSTPMRDDLNVDFKKIVDYEKIPCFNVGGNALGGCMYFAKAILGAGVIIFCGADFSFDYVKKFHPEDSPYDNKFSGLISATDIWGNKVYTWQSYYNFKTWFDFTATGGKGNNPIIMINATEGGIMGAYPQGNIKQIIQMDLSGALYTFNMSDRMPDLMEKMKQTPCLLY